MSISVYQNLTQNTLSERRQEALDPYIQLILWGRKHPVAFIEKVFRITLMDYQAYLIESSWTARTICWCCSRSSGKSFLMAVYIMAKAILFPQQLIRLLAPVTRQSTNLYMKMEQIAKHNIASLVGTSSVFSDELVKSKSDSDGHVHSATNGYSCTLFNGSIISTVPGTAKTAVSLRSSLNVYDECGEIDATYATLTEAFAAQDQGFKTGGGDFDVNLLPENCPAQLFYIGSATDVDSYFFQKYKEAAYHMLMGDDSFFVADIDCSVPLAPTIKGVPWKPLLTQEKIDSDMKLNETKAIREYYNKFDRTGGVNSVFRRSDIVKFSEDYLPVHQSEGKNKKYIIAFDPALQNDNSILLLMEYWQDKKDKMWKGKVVNVINMIEVYPDGSKHQLRTPDQLKKIRETILAYNGEAAPYENIHLIVDIGAGGNGRSFCEHLWSDFMTDSGDIKPGVIDLSDENSGAQQNKYPHAKNVVTMLEPRKNRQKMFEAASSIVKEGLITFPMELPRTSTVIINEKEVVIGDDDFKSFLEMDLMKEEMVAFVKEVTAAGNINYRLPPEKERRIHDDRNFAFAMAAFYISELNRATLLDNEEKTSGMDEYYGTKRHLGSFGSRKSTPTKSNPFGHINKPFRDLKIR